VRPSADKEVSTDAERPSTDAVRPSGLEPTAAGSSLPQLFERIRAALRSHCYSHHTEKAYLAWVRRFVLFHGGLLPDVLGTPQIAAFLSFLATSGRVSPSTQNQAFSALLFLYREVLGRRVLGLDTVPRARRALRVPIVLSRAEIEAILGKLRGAPRLIVSLMYGSGLRLLECCQLRVRDVDLRRPGLTIRDGKGAQRPRHATPRAARCAPAFASRPRQRPTRLRLLGRRRPSDAPRGARSAAARRQLRLGLAVGLPRGPLGGRQGDG
jgi:integrase